MSETITKPEAAPAPDEAPIMSPEAILTSDHRRREWITLKVGRCCVWELSVPEMTQITERASRPKIDPRGGMDPGESMLWQICLSCYDGDGDGARRIFDAGNPTHVKAIMSLGSHDAKRLMATIAQVNGASEVEVEALEDFLPAPPARTA